MTALLLSLLLSGVPLRPGSQEPPVRVPAADSVAPDTIPPDTYADPGARALVERARRARTLDERGTESYEGLLRERLYLGFSGLTFRRERSLLRSERVARIRWSREEGKTIQWIGARDEAPILGPGGRVIISDADSTGDRTITMGLASEDAPEEMRWDAQGVLLQSLDPLLFDFHPGDDRLVLGDQVGLHPLADSAAYHYRYRSGDILEIRLPTEDRTVRLVEVLVEPRRADPRLLAASLWFDQATGTLARATFKPSRPYDLGENDPDADIPGIFQPMEMEFEYFTVEYSLQEFQWWLPRRFGLEGEFRAGSFLRIPMAVEWSMGDYLVNTEQTLIPDVDSLAEGWASRSGTDKEEDGTEEAVTVLVPPSDSLWNSPELTGEMLGPSPIAFSDQEIEELAQRMEGLIPGYELFRPRVAYGLADRNLRFNRVEGVGLGASATVPLSPTVSFRPRLRIGVPELQLRGSLSLLRGPEDHRVGLTVFRRLAHTSDFGNPLGLGASLSNLLFRNGFSHFYQTTGLELARSRAGRRTRSHLRFFFEDHQALLRETNFYLWRPFTGDTLPTNLRAHEGRVGGMAGELRWQWGEDPGRGVLSGLLRGEAGVGDFDYERALATLAFTRPLGFGSALALEVGGGRGWGSLPVQKSFFLGGSQTLRGYPGSYTWGSSFWMTRAELGTEIPAVRISAFTDLGRAGPSRDLFREKALWSAGGGLSILDGLLRMDLAWPLREESGMRFYLYMDALF